MHPTHSMMGIGQNAQAILSDHEKAGFPCGVGTPWEKNALSGGKVLLIGVGQKCNTTYHCPEEQIDNPYQLSSEVINGVVVSDGIETVIPSRLHVWSNHPDFSILNPELTARGYLTTGTVGKAQTLFIQAKGFVDLCLAKMRSDRLYFLR